VLVLSLLVGRLSLCRRVVRRLLVVRLLSRLGLAWLVKPWAVTCRWPQALRRQRLVATPRFSLVLARRR
jgi:hypothetical protein